LVILDHQKNFGSLILITVFRGFSRITG